MAVSFMKQSINALFVSTFLSLSVFSSAPALAEDTSYFVSENLFTYIHSGPGKQYRIIGSVNSATPVTRLAVSEDGEFVQIQDGKGREGWIEADTLSEGQTRQQQIEYLQQQVDGLASQLQQEQQAVRQRLSEVEQLQQQAVEQQQRMDQAIQERDVIQQKLAGYTDEIEMKWFINGSLVAGGGVLLGLILSFVSRKKKRSDRWM